MSQYWAWDKSTPWNTHELHVVPSLALSSASYSSNCHARAWPLTRPCSQQSRLSSLYFRFHCKPTPVISQCYSFAVACLEAQLGLCTQLFHVGSRQAMKKGCVARDKYIAFPVRKSQHGSVSLCYGGLTRRQEESSLPFFNYFVWLQFAVIEGCRVFVIKWGH